jgi:hypothetical protein
MFVMRKLPDGCVKTKKRGYFCVVVSFSWIARVPWSLFLKISEPLFQKIFKNLKGK